MALIAPAARICRIDMNEDALRRGRRLYRDIKSILFEVSDWRRIKSHGSYDLVMVNTVLCRHLEARDVDDISKLLPFSQFENTLGILVEILSVGGGRMAQNVRFPPRQRHSDHHHTGVDGLPHFAICAAKA